MARSGGIANLCNADNPPPLGALGVHACSRMRRIQNRCHRIYEQGGIVFLEWLTPDPVGAPRRHQTICNEEGHQSTE